MFPFHHAASSRKKSTKCRLIFRTTIINSDGMEETLQVSSLPILCSKLKIFQFQSVYKLNQCNVDAKGVYQCTLFFQYVAQPPGQPEICKKSSAESLSKGGQELFIIGKNFLKDTKVVFQEETAQGELLWEARADILKDYLQQVQLGRLFLLLLACELSCVYSTVSYIYLESLDLRRSTIQG